MGVTAEEAEGERGGEQRSAASSSGNFRFRDVLEAEDASCLRGCCVDDVLREPNPVWCVCGGGGVVVVVVVVIVSPTLSYFARRISRLQLPLLNRSLCDACVDDVMYYGNGL